MTRPWMLIIAAAALGSAVACNGGSTTAPPATVAPPAVTPTPTVTLRAPGTGSVPALAVTSTAFANGAAIPAAEALSGCGGTTSHRI